MPTPMPIIAASCGVQSTTSSTRVPTIPMIERLMTIANSAFSSGRPIATTPSVMNSTIAATMMPKISPAPPVSAVDQWMMSPPSATWRPPLPSISRTFSAISLTGFGSTSPGGSLNWIWANVIRPSLETGAPSANGSATASTSGDFLISAVTASISARLSSTLPFLTANTTLAVSPDCCGNLSRSRSYARWDSVPGRLKLLTNSPAAVPQSAARAMKAATHRPITVRRRSWHHAASLRISDS